MKRTILFRPSIRFHFRNLAFVHSITLTPDNYDFGTRATQRSSIREPSAQIQKTVATRYIINENDASRIAIIIPRDGAKPLLPGRVPEMESESSRLGIGGVRGGEFEERGVEFYSNSMR